jgi:hypothetical protein
LSRNWSIQSGSPFIREMSSTTSLARPRRDLKTYFSSSWNPYFSS